MQNNTLEETTEKRLDFNAKKKQKSGARIGL